MDLLACILLRKQSQKHQLRHAFDLIKYHQFAKNNNVSFRDQLAFGSASKTLPSVEVENRQLYLSYMEEVLKNKQKQLSKLEQELVQSKRNQQKIEAQYKFSRPLEMTHLAQFLQKKCTMLIDLLSKYSKQYPKLQLDQEYLKFLQSVDFLQQTCNQNYRLLKEELVNNYEQLINEKQSLQIKINKLQELESYEKYLTKLQNALEQKQFQIIQKEEALKNIQQKEARITNDANLTLDLEIGNSTPQYNTYEQEHNTINSSTSQRKRSRIFDTKKTPKTYQQVSAHKESSKIMQQKSTGQQLQPSIINAPYIIEEFPCHQNGSEIGTQANIQDPRIQANNYIHNQGLYLKFIKLWLKYSEKKHKQTSPHKMVMNLYHWRLNALYDQGIKTSAKQIIMWPAKIQKLGNLSYFNYGQLTLRKQKYLENFFDFERRKFQREKIATILKSVLKNKNRKQRIAVFVYFKKYKQTTKMISLCKNIHGSQSTSQTEALRQITTQPSQNTYLDHSRSKNHSSGYIDHPLKQSQQKSKNCVKNSANSKLKSTAKQNKENNNNIDIEKLKEYIKGQEQTERKLAVECARTEAVFRILDILKNNTSKVQTHFIMNLSRNDQSERLENLSRAVGSYQFKWQLFMAKARLALTSNNNKISHLEQLLSFVGSDK